MDNLLLDLAALTVGAHSLVVGSVLLSVPLDVDCSYIDGGSCVVFIVDTTPCTSGVKFGGPNSRRTTKDRLLVFLAWCFG